MADLKIILAIVAIILSCVVALAWVVGKVVIAREALAKTKPIERPDILRALAEVFEAGSPRGRLVARLIDGRQQPAPEPTARAPVAPGKPRAVK